MITKFIRKPNQKNFLHRTPEMLDHQNRDDIVFYLKAEFNDHVDDKICVKIPASPQ